VVPAWGRSIGSRGGEIAQKREWTVKNSRRRGFLEYVVEKSLNETVVPGGREFDHGGVFIVLGGGGGGGGGGKMSLVHTECLFRVVGRTENVKKEGGKGEKRPKKEG